MAQANWFWPGSYWGEHIKTKNGVDLPTPTQLGDITEYETLYDEEDALCKGYNADELADPQVLITVNNDVLTAEFFGGYPNKPPHK